MSATSYTVAVRTLCEFAAKQGDLDFRFTPSPSADEGMAVHRAVAQKRGPGYRAEVSVEGLHRHLKVRGRADGYHAGEALLEEVKSYKGELARMPANHRALHWAQAKVYAALLCQRDGMAAMNVALVYVDALSLQAAAPLVERVSTTDLQAFFAMLCERFIDWADREVVHRVQRDAGLVALHFPHASFRAGQRSLSEAVFTAARRGRCLLAQAPTGIGKTVGTLFPLLKALPDQTLDKLFYLTAKGSGRGVALAAVATILAREPHDSHESPAAHVPPLRVIELVARDKACEHPDKACHGDSCPLARGFYDRLAAARSEAVDSAGLLCREEIRALARRHAVCPYYLTQEVARWCDVVIGDYNHFFDDSAFLHALTVSNAWRVAVLVDEAHNLIERARSCYTAALDPGTFRIARLSAPPTLKRPFDRLSRAWKRAESGDDSGHSGNSGNSVDSTYAVLPAPPSRLNGALQELIAAIGSQHIEQPESMPPELLAFYFEAMRFARLQELFDAAHSMVDATRPVPADPRAARGPQTTLCIRNVNPAVFLKPRLAAARSVVLFSATLTPMQFYADTLGLPDDAAWLDVATPYRADQLRVRIAANVSTRYHGRAATLAPIAGVIRAQFDERPGNYIAFFSSFDYMERAAAAFVAAHPEICVWQQPRRMDEQERQGFLDRFVPDGQGVGFAVLGGSFAEGVDLPGTRLIGVVIATLGLPPVNPVNEELRRRLDASFGRGFDYTYLYPGLRKVVQAAGRVLRTSTDTGSVHLIDDRFQRPEVLRLLPSWWRIERTVVAD